MKAIIATAALALAAGLAGGTAPAAAAETILFNCFFPPQHYVCREFLPEMKDRIETATEGRVRLRVPPNSLAAPPEQLAGVRRGVMDGAVQFNGFLAAEAPGMQFAMLPFVGTARSQPASVALWDTYQQFFAPLDEIKDAVLVSVLAINGGDLYSVTDTPLTSVADLSERKTWSVAGPTAEVIKATGSAPVAGPVVQMLEIVSRGVVDAFIGPPQSEVTQYKLTEYTKSATIFDDKIFQGTFSFYVSREKWDAIEEADRAAILQALGSDFAGWMGKRQDEIFEAAHQELVDAGVQFIDGSPEFLADLKALGQPQIDAWVARADAAGVDGNAVIAAYRDGIAAQAAAE